MSNLGMILTIIVIFLFLLGLFLISKQEMESKRMLESECIVAGKQVIRGDCVN